MYYQRTYLDKCATIIMGSEYNTGLNPVSDLVWGSNSTRLLVHFNHDKIKQLVEDKVYPDITKLKHTLKITNAGSLDMSELHKVYSSQIDGTTKKRASSFDLIFFLIPSAWDVGKGFVYNTNYFNKNFYDNRTYDASLYKLTDGVNWYQSRNGKKWADLNDFVRTDDELFNFYIKADKQVIPSSGDKVILTYYAVCNNNYTNLKLELEQLSKSESSVEIGSPICFAKNGQICYTDTQKQKYCTYIQVAVNIPSTNSTKMKKHSFRLKYEVDGKEYKSNPYSIKQLGTTEQFYPQKTDGIYSTKTLENELAKFNNGEESIIIGKQHFDIGTENIELDITNTFNKFITGELKNYGIGIAFAPYFEYENSIIENYVGFLTNKTNSFFEPFVETINTESIYDDRTNFVLGKANKLYLCSTIGGKLENLDKLPTCTINEETYEVHQASKGIYYIDVNLPIDAFKAPTMLYDTWDGLIYQGQELKPVELDFTVQLPYSHFGIGTAMPEKNEFTPTIYGISDNEIIKRGDVRKLCVNVRKNYTKNEGIEINDIQMRMYVMDGTAQVDVIPYMDMNKIFTENYTLLDTSILIPNEYLIDVKVNFGMESIIHHNILKFKIVDDTKNKYN